jgi:DNA repair exonuclease SbcCD nuclease subunit
MTRLAVLADPHCDDFGSKIDPATGLNARWVDTVDMVRWVANDAKERGADALIVAGDLSESRHPAPWRVAQIGAALAAFPGPVKLLRGNHDGTRAGLSIVDALAQDRPGWDGFSRPGITVVADVAIAMLPYLDRAWIRAQPGFESTPDADVYRILAEQFLAIARGLFVQAQGVASRTVLVVHQALAGGNMSDSQRAFLGDLSLVVDTRALGAIGYDAILAGHFHLHQVLSSDPLIAYAGSPYRTDFGEEHQAKGYLIVDVGPVAGWADMHFVETPARRFVTLRDRCYIDLEEVRDAVVRCIDVDPDLDPANLRKLLEESGAFEVQEIRIRRDESPVAAGGLSETLAPAEALEAYFAETPDAKPIVARGREILQAVA